MRIIQILNSPNWSGASNYCISVTKELMNLGHEVLLLTEPGKPLYRAQQLGIPCDDTIRLNHRNPLLYVHAIKRMKAIFKSFKPDIISSHINEGAWMAGMIAKKVVPEAVVARIRTDIDPPKGHFINRYVHHVWTDHIVVGSMLHKKLCQQILDYAPEKVSVVYGGVDTDLFNPSRATDSEFRKEISAEKHELLIGLLARLDPVKGHEYAIGAIAALKELPVKFRLVAAGYENERTFAWLKQLAAENGVADRLVCLGLRKDLPDVLAALDIGLITSVGSEANSRAALEFMASGKPVVGTSVGVIPEIVHHEEQGFIVEPRNATATAAALEKLITSPLLRQRLGQSARQSVEANFSLPRFGRVMESVYQKLLPGRNRS
ncbi:MAG TPA: glycosyltransferase family 4 protein [Candidatus Rifleibacterium sp.]|nr:glycosyltransferase family 4 protein [Candidatus Rifleibacterium sp.]